MDNESKSVCKQVNYEHLFNAHSRTLFNFIYYKCGDAQLSEDIVQESYTKLWVNCSKVIFDKAKSYLFTIARNLFLNDAEHKKIVLKYQSIPENNSTNQTPEFLLEEQEFWAKLNRVIASLPEKQREVFLLSRIDKKKYSEIAEITGVTVKAVEKRMSLALITLRDKLGNI
ncbi:RNA polymerase sigma factor [Gaetbulibacter saemankumensis]|uniref:RNA polymerase sigma factor n=1 Tax=Gaetbulibacter saemankumensis TaxID=311208 RepID=UPI0003FC1B7A|nr:sigma-70 family RNA polymerase sigma factor [Gaetbulibacter saemankumensis]